jgi:hypothetical protein
MKTIWGSQQALVAIEANYIAGTIKERCATTAPDKMLIERRSLEGIEIVVDVI